MNNLSALETVHHHYATSPELNDLKAGYFSSSKFLDALAEMEQNPREMARLTIGMLENMALDPREGTRFEDFVKYAGQPWCLTKLKADSDSIWFCLRFYSVTNFLGTFTLPMEAPEMPLILDAIRKNLASRRFKAAQASSRLVNKMHRRFARIAKPAVEARVTHLTEAFKTAPKFSHYQEHEQQAYERAAYELSEQAFNVVYKPLRERLEKRMLAVKKAAFTKAFQGSYFDMLITFADMYLLPQHRTLH